MDCGRILPISRQGLIRVVLELALTAASGKIGDDHN
jgi:hypothetical protein